MPLVRLFPKESAWRWMIVTLGWGVALRPLFYLCITPHLFSVHMFRLFSSKYCKTHKNKTVKFDRLIALFQDLEFGFGKLFFENLVT